VTIHYPTSRAEWLALRHKYVSSTDQAALHGLSPYMTAFELYHDKKQPEPTKLEKSERVEWGIRMEEAVARAIADQYGIKVRKLNCYVSRDGTGMGASFDYEIVGIKEGDAPEGPILQKMYEANGPGLLEIKTVDWFVFKRQWPETEDGENEAPPHIEIQVQHQLHCIERKWAAIGVLVGGNNLKLLVRDYDEEFGARIERETKKFWKDVAANKSPPPVLPQDAELIARIYSFGDPSKVLDAQGNAEVLALCKDYLDAGLLAKGAEERKKTAKAKLLQLIGDASRTIVDENITISANTIGTKRIEAYDRKEYRDFRINQKATKDGKD
jgi:putative phage-type endonuclease